MKIYTKTGDKGKTRLIGGASVSKAAPRLEAYGSVDELGACLGLAAAELKNSASEISAELEKIQNNLFFVGSLFACEDAKFASQLPSLPENSVSELEQRIDEWTAKLPPLKDFILSGGSKGAAHLHLCRTVCRRAERMSVAMMDSEEIPPELQASYSKALIYLNRLSDYLFTAARYANHLQGQPDVIWKKS